MSKKTEKPKDAFVSSERHVLNGLKLQPWTPDRIIAGQSMGMLYPQIGKKGYDQYKRTKTYPGIVKDLIICLWLCSVDEDRVDEADSLPDTAYSEARKWAAPLGIHKMNSEEWDSAFPLFADIISEVENSITLPKSESGDDDDEGKE